MKTRIVALLAGLTLAACGPVPEARPDSIPADEVRAGGLTFEQWQDTLEVEAETGRLVVDFDTTLERDSKEALGFFQAYVEQGQLIVHTVNGVDAKWSDTQKLNLSYCVSSSSFGSRYSAAVAEMAAAAANWEAVANVNFVHVSAQDSNCTASNTNVLFDVRMVSGQSYLARAFFPDSSRSGRNVLIDSSAFGTTGWSLEGILTHELGHTLGFRHEHTRPNAGTCFEDNNWRALTVYDPYSVMHYPQCNGSQTGDLSITALDAQGAAALYGAAGGGGGGGGDTTDTTETFSGSVASGANAFHGPFAVTAGAPFIVNMTGTGDPDLYVQFGSQPTTSSYACRPYQSGATEACNLTVPTGQSTAYIMVRGYTAATYSLTVKYKKGAGGGGGGTATTATYSSQSVASGAWRYYGGFSVVPGTTFKAAASGGTGDADLYVRFGAQPTASSYACRPYLGGNAETCTVTVPAGQTSAYVGLYGYSAASGVNLTINYVKP